MLTYVKRICGFLDILVLYSVFYKEKSMLPFPFFTFAWLDITFLAEYSLFRLFAQII